MSAFLTKHLLLPWQEGEAWFWDTLVDADYELDVLCARLRASNETSLTIVHVSGR